MTRKINTSAKAEVKNRVEYPTLQEWLSTTLYINDFVRKDFSIHLVYSARRVFFTYVYVYVYVYYRMRSCPYVRVCVCACFPYA